MIHEPSIERIKDGSFNSEHFVELLKGLAAQCAAEDAPGCQVAISYIDAADDFVVGSYVPEIHLVLRRVE